MSPDRIRRIRRRLLSWYDRNARDLPWRQPQASIYHKWVAEIMLQQTRVDTVLGYYNVFLRRFPTVKALAAASLADVLTIWQGLGYYRRAENLHRAAAIVAERGSWPETLADWLALPGIGPYTAGAISSMAQGARAPAVDGNVRRVLARLLPVTVSTTSPPGELLINQAATRLLPAGRSGDFNQAWMDLASAICLPRNPDCPHCPLTDECAARVTGDQNSWPIRRQKALPLAVERLAVAFVLGNRILLVQRPEGGRWSGLWELPNCQAPESPLGAGPHSQTQNGSPRRTAVSSPPLQAGEDVRAIIQMAIDLQLPAPSTIEFLTAIQHQLTHRTYRFHLYRANLACPPHVLPRRPRRRWISPTNNRHLPVSTAQRKLIQALVDRT